MQAGLLVIRLCIAAMFVGLLVLYLGGMHRVRRGMGLGGAAELFFYSTVCVLSNIFPYTV